MPDNTHTQRRLNFIDNAERNLISGISGIDTELWKKVRELTEKIRTEEKRITSSAANYSLLGQLNAIGREIQSGPKRLLISNIVDDLIQQSELVKSYFNDFLKLERTGIQTKVYKNLLYRIGYDGKGFVERGVLFDLYNDDSPIRQVKAMTVKAIASGRAFKEFVDDMEGFILGDENKLGVTAAHLLTATRDVFAQNDRSLTKQYADEYNLDKFIFSGGLMKTTRDFCRQRNGKIFTRKQIEEWASLDFDGKPGGYVPFIDVGGYNCRHVLDPISNEVAAELGYKEDAKKVVVPPGPEKTPPPPAPEQMQKEREKKPTPPPPAKKSKASKIKPDDTIKTPKQIEKEEGITRTRGKIDPKSVEGKSMSIVESVIREQKFESGAVYSRDGKFIYFKNGKKAQVEWYQDEIGYCKDAILTHNHPSGSSFSLADIQFLTSKRIGLYEIRAVGNEYTYSLKKPNFELDDRRIREIRSFHNEVLEELTPKFQSLVKERFKEIRDEVRDEFEKELSTQVRSLSEIRELTAKSDKIREKREDEARAEIWREISHEKTVRIAEEFGFEYTRKKRYE